MKSFLDYLTELEDSSAKYAAQNAENQRKNNLARAGNLNKGAKQAAAGDAADKLIASKMKRTGAASANPNRPGVRRPDNYKVDMPKLRVAYDDRAKKLSDND